MAASLLPTAVVGDQANLDSLGHQLATLFSNHDGPDASQGARKGRHGKRFRRSVGTDPFSTDPSRTASVEAGATPPSFSGSLDSGGLVKLATLEAAYRSNEPGWQLQAIELFGQLFDEHPFQAVTSAAFIKLADWFRTTSNNLIRYHIFRVFERSHAHLRNLLTADEVVKSVSHVLESTEPLARALTLRTLGCVGFTLAERINIQQNIIKKLRSPSHDQLELEAAIYGAEKICARSETFSERLLDSGVLENITTGPSMTLSVKLLAVKVYMYMNSSPEVAAKAMSLCLELFHRQREPQFRISILLTMSRLASRALAELDAQVGLLIAIATGNDIFPVKLEAMRNLRTLVRHLTDQITPARLETLLMLLRTTDVAYATAPQRRSAFQQALLRLLTDLFSQGFGPSLFVETVCGVAANADNTNKIRMLLDVISQCEGLVVEAPTVQPAGHSSLVGRAAFAGQPDVSVGPPVEKTPYGSWNGTRTLAPLEKHSWNTRNCPSQQHGSFMVAVYGARFLVQLLAIWKSPTVVRALWNEGSVSSLHAYFNEFPFSFSRMILLAVSRGVPCADGRANASRLELSQIRGLLDCLIATVAVVKWMPAGGFPRGARVHQSDLLVSEVSRELLRLAQAPAPPAGGMQALLLKCLSRLAEMHPLAVCGSSIEQDHSKFELFAAETKCGAHDWQLPPRILILRLLLCSASALPAVGEMQDREAFESYFKSALTDVSAVTGWSMYVLARDAAHYGWWELCLWLLSSKLKSLARSEETGLWLLALESASRAESVLVGASAQGASETGGHVARPLAGLMDAILAARCHLSRSCGCLKALSSISSAGSWRFQRWYLQLRSEFLEISRYTLAHLSLLSRSTSASLSKLRGCAERYRVLEKRYSFLARSFFGLDSDSNRALDSLRLVALVLTYVIGRVAWHGEQYQSDADVDVVVGPLTTILMQHGYTLDAVLRDIDRSTFDVFPKRKDVRAATPLRGYALHVLRHFQERFDADANDMTSSSPLQGLMDLINAIQQGLQIPMPAPASLFTQDLSTVAVLLATTPRSERGRPVRIQCGKLLKVTVEGAFDVNNASGCGIRTPVKEVEVSYYISSISHPSFDSIDDQIASEDDSTYWRDVPAPVEANADVEIDPDVHVDNSDSDDEDEDEDVSRVTRMQRPLRITASITRAAWRTEWKAKRAMVEDGYFRTECKFQTAIHESYVSGADQVYVRIRCALVDPSRENLICPVNELSLPLVLT